MDKEIIPVDPHRVDIFADWRMGAEAQKDRPDREKIAEILYGELTYKNYLSIPEVRRNADLKIDRILALLPDVGTIVQEIFEEIERLSKAGQPSKFLPSSEYQAFKQRCLEKYGGRG